MRCRRCRSEIEEWANYCRFCGTPVPRRPNFRRRWPAYAMVLGLAVLAATVAGLAWRKHPQSPLPVAPTALSTQPLPAIIQRDLPAVVSVTADTAQGADQGSGFVYDRRGDILTNAHVVSGASQIWVGTSNGRRYPATLLGENPTQDLAALRVPALASIRPLPLADSSQVELGDSVVAFGSPLGLRNTVTEGTISGLHRNFSIPPAVYRDLLQISAPVAPGNSGGPLVLAASGAVVGIETAGVVNLSGNIGFAIPINQAKPLAAAWASASNAAASSEGLVAESEALLTRFYQAINARQYAQAWGMLGQRWRHDLPYPAFAAGFQHTVQDSLSQVAVVHADAKTVLLGFQLVAQSQTPSGQAQVTTYRMQYQFGLEQGRLVILSGKAVAQSPPTFQP